MLRNAISGIRSSFRTLEWTGQSVDHTWDQIQREQMFN